MNTQVKVLVDNCGHEKQKIWCICHLQSGLWLPSSGGPLHKGGQHVYGVMVVRINHVIAVIGRSACRAASLKFDDLLVLAAYPPVWRLQIDFVGRGLRLLLLLL